MLKDQSILNEGGAYAVVKGVSECEVKVNLVNSKEIRKEK